MKLGMVSDSLKGLGFEAMLDKVAELGMSGVEMTVGGWSEAPHVDLAALKESAEARARFRKAFEARGLRLMALNANGNPLHPTDRTQADCLVDALRLAGELGVEQICTMSGLPAGSPGDSVPNWIVSSWPVETQEALRYQWEDVLFPFWSGIVALAQDAGVQRIALEMHGNQCVYNVPTLLQLRDAVGPMIGATLDPSQLVWMGADPLAAVGALNEALAHVHARDTLINSRRRDLTSVLDTGAQSEVSDRSWSHVTLGYGHGADWWRRFFHRLSMVGYDGWVAIDHEDAVLCPVEGVEKSVALMREVIPFEVVEDPC